MIESQSHPASRKTLRLVWALFAISVVALVSAWLLFGGELSSGVKPPTGSASTTSLASAELSGGVRDNVGRLIAAAQVCAYGAQTETQLHRQCVATDVHGNYQFSMPPGQYSITASAADHASRSSVVTLSESQPAQLDFTLDAQAHTLAGIVLDATGKRLNSARVTVLEGEEAIANVVTNAQGEFFASTAMGPFTVKAEAAGFGATLVQTVAPTMDIRITLFPGNVVAGKVLFKDVLRPAPNVRVLATSRTDRMVMRQRDAAVRTDAQGNFFFADLAAGEWMLSVDGPNAFGTLVDPIRVGMDHDVRDVTLLVQPARKVVGRFVVGDDKPCPEGQIQFVPEALARELALQPDGIRLDQTSVDFAATPIVHGSTGSSGAFEIAALPYGDYAIRARCREHEFSDGPSKLAVGEHSVDELVFKFDPGLGLTVRVIDDSQKPIPNIAVTLLPAQNDGWSQTQTLFAQRGGQTDSKGEYRFGGLVAGNYVATAKYASLNGKESVEKPISLQGSGELEPLTFTLPGSGSIRIRARSTAGAAIGRMLFFALDSDGTRYEGKYAGDGASNIGPLPRESYRVFGYDNKNAKATLNGGRAVQVAGNGVVELDFQYAEPTGQLQGRVIDSNGAPMPGTFIRAVSTKLDEDDERYSPIQLAIHGPQELLTDREGRFRIVELDSQGVYDLHIDHPEGLQEVRHGVTPGSFVEVAFPAAGRIDGIAVDSSGKQISSFDVVTVNLTTGARRSQSFSGAGGVFTLGNVGPGDVHIAIYDNSSGLRAEQTGKLAAGQSLSIGRVVLSAGDAADSPHE